jgi:hypothetical protein
MRLRLRQSEVVYNRDKEEGGVYKVKGKEGIMNIWIGGNVVG